MLTLVVVLILFASLALTRMNCNRIANYFLLPVFFSLVYINLVHHHNHYKGTTIIKESGPSTFGNEKHSSRDTIVSKDNDKVASISGLNDISDGYNNNSSSLSLYIPVSIVDTIELTLTNGLGLILIVQLTVNLFANRLADGKARISL